MALPQPLSRLLWFVALWAASVAAIVMVGYGIRLMLVG